MAKTIRVTPEQLTNAAAKIEGLAEEYKTLYERFYTETNAMSASWKGRDNIAFINQIDGFKDDFEKMFNAMTRYAEFLKTHAKTYSDAQDAVVAQAKKLQN